MAYGLQSRGRFAAAAVVLASVAATSAARAQCFAPGGVPVIAVPPPAQSIAMPPKPKPAAAPAPQPAPSSDASSQPQVTCRYQGQTRVCN